MTFPQLPISVSRARRKGLGRRKARGKHEWGNLWRENAKDPGAIFTTAPFPITLAPSPLTPPIFAASQTQNDLCTSCLNFYGICFDSCA